MVDDKVKDEQTLPSVSPPPNLLKNLPVECKATQCKRATVYSGVANLREIIHAEVAAKRRWPWT